MTYSLLKAWKIPKKREHFFKPILIDLNKYSDEELKTHGASAAFELIMKHVFDKSTRLNIERIGEAFNQTDGLFRDSALEYILSSSDFETDMFNDVFAKYIDVEKLMTIEKRLKQEGKLEGARESLEQVARKSLAKGFDIQIVSEITGLDLVMVKKIKSTMI